LPMNRTNVRIADWHKDNADIRRIRDSVFTAEQAVPPELEWDAEDSAAIHFLALEGDYAIGTARLLLDGEIGRLSVLKDWRNMKVGEALLSAVIEEAERRDLKQQKLSAQVQAVAFYEQFGFTVVSEEFLEAGLPHVNMTRNAD
jgi:predicted GNAT family N-acyltransferase